MRRLRKSRKLCPCFLENRNLRVGVLPEHEEIVVGAFRLHCVTRQYKRSCQLQARQRIDRIDEGDAPVIENPLELGDRFGGLLRNLVCQPANINRIQLAEESIEADAAERQIEARGTLQRLNRS